MIQLTVDGKKITVTDDSATILDAARQAGINIPTMCHNENIAPPVSCFICVVKINGQANYVPACATPAKDGMTVDTNSPQVRERRKQALELMLSEHAGKITVKKIANAPADNSASTTTDDSDINTALPLSFQCACARKNTCRLKTYAEEYGADPQRYTDARPQNTGRKTYNSGLVHEPGKCVVCGKCVNITKSKNIIPGLSLTGRGSNVHVSAPFGIPFDEAMGGALKECADKCPTGALWLIPYSSPASSSTGSLPAGYTPVSAK